MDSYGTELLHPVRKREKTIKPRIATKGKSNYRWIMGAKLGFIINQFGLVVDWATAKEIKHDTIFQPMIARYDQQSMILGDSGFHAKAGDPINLKICKTSEWNNRMLVETALFMLTVVCHIKKQAHRAWLHFKARLSFTLADFHLLVQWQGLRPDQDQLIRLSMAQFSL